MASKHEYRVVICDHHGIAQGEIRTAVVTSLSAELNGIWSATFTFPTLDAEGAALLPPSMFPGVVEVQIWRDGQVLWWGVPVSASADRVRVTVQCSGLLWYFKNILVGPESMWQAPNLLPEYLMNRQFEDGLNDWLNIGLDSATVDTRGGAPPNNIVLLDGASARLATVANVDAFLMQTGILLAPTAGDTLFALAGWYFIDHRNVGYSGPAAQNRGLYIEIHDDTSALRGVSFAQIAANVQFETWTRLETSIVVPEHTGVWTAQVRLYGVGGEIVWDDISLTVPQSVGSDPGGSDMATTIDRLITYANNPAAGKWAMNIPFDSTIPPIGITKEQVYQFYDHTSVLDILNVLPTTGICDFFVDWPNDPAASATARFLHLAAPAKGVVRPETPLVLGASSFTDLTVNVDGSQVRTAVRSLGQGSGGQSRETGYAAFPCYLGGRISPTTASIFSNSSQVTTSAPFFQPSDVGQPIYGLTGARLSDGAFFPGTTIKTYLSPTAVLVSTVARYTDAATVIGIGGVIIDDVTSSVLNQNGGDVHASALQTLTAAYKPLVIPIPKLDAEKVIGVMSTGDVIPVSIDYGWVQIPETFMRIIAITLYPQTEEVTLKLNPVAVVTS